MATARSGGHCGSDCCILYLHSATEQPCSDIYLSKYLALMCPAIHPRSPAPLDDTLINSYDEKKDVGANELSFLVLFRL